MRYLFIFLLLLVAGSSTAQSVGASVVNTAGDSFKQNDIIFEWSVGELALIETMTGSQGSITNGLLQPVPSAQIITAGYQVFPANILTANGDGANDTWIVKDLERYPDNEVTVIDRAGRIVFQTKNYQNNWTGHLSGSPLAEGTYYYVIKLNKDGNEGIVKGFITILY